MRHALLPVRLRSAVSRHLAPLAAAVLVAAGCGATGAGEQQKGDGASAAPAASGAVVTDSIALRAIADTSRILGSPQAKVWLIIASDFQCPYCKVWHDQTFDALRQEYVETGKVRVAYVHYPLDQHPQALPAAEATMCAGAQGRFWPYEKALFARVERWGAPGDQSAVYDSIATEVGADAARFRSCMQSHVMRPLVEADRDRMSRAGVRSTPSFFVNDTPISGAQPTAVFREALDAALARAGS